MAWETITEWRVFAPGVDLKCNSVVVRSSGEAGSMGRLWGTQALLVSR